MPTYADLVSRLGKLDVALQESPLQPDLAVYNLFQVPSLKAWYQDSVDALATSDQRSLNLLVDQLAQSIRKLRCACDSEALAKAFEEAPQDVQARLTKLNNIMKARLRVFNDLAADLVASTHEVDTDAKKHAQMIIETEHRLASEIGALSSRIARVSFQNLTHDTLAVEDLLKDSLVPRLDVFSSQSRSSTKQASTKTKPSVKTSGFVKQDANMLQTLHTKLLRVYTKLSAMRDDLAKAQVEGNLVLASRLKANIQQLKSNALAIGGACQLAASANRKRVLVNMYTSSRGDYKRTKHVVSRLEKTIRHAKQPDMLAQWHYVQDRVHEQANGLRVFLTLEAKHEVDQVRRQAVKNMHRNAVMLFELAEKALVPLDLSIAELNMTLIDSTDSADSTDLASKQPFKACAQSLARKYSNDLARILHKLVALFPKSTSQQDQEQQEEQEQEKDQLARPTQVEVLVVSTQPTQTNPSDPNDQNENQKEEKEKEQQEEKQEEKAKEQQEEKQEDKQEEKEQKEKEDQEEDQEDKQEEKEKDKQEEKEKDKQEEKEKDKKEKAKPKPQKDLPVPDLDSLEGVSYDSDQEQSNSEDLDDSESRGYVSDNFDDSESQSYDSQASQDSSESSSSSPKKRKLVKPVKKAKKRTKLSPRSPT